MPNLVMMVGNIGSGKSTAVKLYVERGYKVISRDALRYMLGSGSYIFDTELEPDVFKIEKYALDILTQSGYDIVIDETNMSARGRRRYFEVIKNRGYDVIADVMPKLSKFDSVDRRMKANHGNSTIDTWGKVWDMFDKAYVEPTLDEGFTMILHVGNVGNRRT